jgi:hypothetical protein
MPTFTPVTKYSDIPAEWQGWQKASKFNSKNSLVDINGNSVEKTFAGHQYKLLKKKDYHPSTAEKVGLIILCIVTLSLAYFLSKYIQNALHTGISETKRFAICVNPTYGMNNTQIAQFFHSSATAAQVRVMADVLNQLPAHTLRHIPEKLLPHIDYSELEQKITTEIFLNPMRGSIDYQRLSAVPNPSTRHVIVNIADSYLELIDAQNARPTAADYRLFGLPQGTPTAALKRKYYQLAQTYHPDKYDPQLSQNAGESDLDYQLRRQEKISEAEATFKKIGEAYQRLCK